MISQYIGSQQVYLNPKNFQADFWIQKMHLFQFTPSGFKLQHYQLTALKIRASKNQVSFREKIIFFTKQLLLNQKEILIVRHQVEYYIVVLTIGYKNLKTPPNFTFFQFSIIIITSFIMFCIQNPTSMKIQYLLPQTNITNVKLPEIYFFNALYFKFLFNQIFSTFYIKVYQFFDYTLTIILSSQQYKYSIQHIHQKRVPLYLPQLPNQHAHTSARCVQCEYQKYCMVCNTAKI
eukprot:TRINITY_DN3235_c1_g1_i3.p1 TRINITY_DN3235_c1_g1~~TRINITY_DN3235_c1_g1_i3.p1  ORF type:complete len:234 (-),score=-26.65 TRINITY_DN3235_c1_g1_i3:276-977(-)